mgnify:CR=1 FL=1
MKTNRAAIRYAKALILESIEKDNLELMYSDMQIVLNTFSENENLQSLAESRIIKNSVKLSSLNLIFKDQRFNIFFNSIAIIFIIFEFII